MEVPRTNLSNYDCVQRGGVEETCAGGHTPPIYVQLNKWGYVFVYLR